MFTYVSIMSKKGASHKTSFIIQRAFQQLLDVVIWFD